MAMSSGYAIFCTGSNNELIIYDISNVYAPKQINRIVNPEGITHNRLFLAGETFDALHSVEIQFLFDPHAATFLFSLLA